MSIIDHSRTPCPPSYVVAFDHRGSLDRALAGIGREGGATGRDSVKQLIWQGVETVLPRFDDPTSVGILIDRGHPDIVDRAKAAGVSVAIALEASGRADLRADADDDTLRSELRSAAAHYGKVLIRWRPNDTLSARRRQLDTLGALDAVIADAGTQLLLELLMVNDARNAAGTEAVRVWQEVRMPRAQLDAAGEILGSGLAPALWKIEGHPDMDAAASLASMVQASRSDASILVLGGGADISDLRRLFSCSTVSERFGGFAVGRSIWWPPIAARERGEAGTDETRHAIGERFLTVVDAFCSMAGTPAPVAPDWAPTKPAA